MSNLGKKVDNVNHPKHYEGHTSLECIECMELIFGTEYTCAFCLENAFKYLWRCDNKNALEDVHKAEWYLDWVENKAKQFPDDGTAEISYELLTKIPMLRNLYNKALDKYI